MLDLEAIKSYLKQAERFPLSLATGVANYAHRLVQEVEELRAKVSTLENQKESTMSTFKSIKEQIDGLLDQLHLQLIRSAMIESGIQKDFADQALSFAYDYEGIAYLMKMWEEQTDSYERIDILEDIQYLVEDIVEYKSKKNETQS